MHKPHLRRELQHYLGCFLALFLRNPKKSLRKPLQLVLQFPLILMIFAAVLTSCSWRPCTPEYHAQYQHLNDTPSFDDIQESSYYLVLLVCARRLDYTSGRQLLQTIARHPGDGGKNGDVGHAWVVLHGDQGVLEGGHTGEFGLVQPRYFEGVADLIEKGDPNPVRYLWHEQKDGCFQKGSGGFIPTFAAYVPLTLEQYWKIRDFILFGGYPYNRYAITGHQCAVFVASVAALAGLELEHEVTVPLEPVVIFKGERLCLWSDERYSQLNISTPDILEKSLMQAVRAKRAKNATKWYLRRYLNLKMSLKASF